MLKKKTEAEKVADEVARDVQAIFFLAHVPHYLFTFAMLLFFPTVWFHIVFQHTDGYVPAAVLAWFLGVPTGRFAAHLVPEVQLEALLRTLQMRDTDGRFAHLSEVRSGHDARPGHQRV